MAVQTTTSSVAAPTAITSQAQDRRRFNWGSFTVNAVLAVLCLLWAIPTIGLLVSSFRPPEDILQSGWWTVFPHQDWVKTDARIDLPKDTPLNPEAIIPIPGTTTSVTKQQIDQGVTLPDGRRISWAGPPRERILAVSAAQWTVNPTFTLSNYQNVLGGQQFTFKLADGTEVKQQGPDMSAAFINTVVVVIPATIIPILIAAFAAYAFAWMRFLGRRLMFGLVVALMVVPLQVALIPILRDYQNLNITGTFLALWLAHTGFGLPLATYLLYNYMSQLPREVLESAFIDGASQFTIFTRLILPLSVPALASFAIFQFLWVWNDYLVALIFLGGDKQVLTMRLADIVGTRGQDWNLLTAGAFISMLLPLTMFFSLQRYFVRGLLAGSVKG